MSSKRSRFYAVAFAVTILVAATIRGTALAEDEPTIQVTPSVPAVLAGEVFEGEPNLVVIEEAVSLLPGHLVDTDRRGEALLEVFLADQEVCEAHLFRTSKLLFWSQLNTSPCSKAELGSSRCLELSLGSVLFHGCSDFTVMTPNGQVQVTGTTFFIAYFPEVETTIIKAFEGTVEARVLANPEAVTLSEPLVIDQGQALFATPVEASFTLAGQSANTPFALELAPQAYSDLAAVYVGRDLIEPRAVPALDFSSVREEIGLRLPQLLPEFELLPAPELYDLRRNQLPTPDDALAVGVLWGVDFEEYRWNRDEIALASSLETLGASYLPAYALGSVERQLEEVERLIELGIDTIVLATPGGDTLLPIVERARQAGVAVVAYDGVIASPGVVNVSFDNRNVVPERTVNVISRPQPPPILVPDALLLAPTTVTTLDPEIRIAPRTETIVPLELEIANLENRGLTVVASPPATFEIDPNWNRLVVADRNIAMIAEEQLVQLGRRDSVEIIGRGDTIGMFQLLTLGSLDAVVWEDGRRLASRAAEVAVDLARGIPISALAGLNDRPSPTAQNVIWVDAQLVDGASLAEALNSGWIAREVVCQGALVLACQ